jgi:hypothetical protein
MSSKPPKFEFRAYPPAKVAKVANFMVGENQASQLSQVSQVRESEPIFFDPEEKGTRGRCVECPWCQDNPWTHYPELRAWCHYRMEPLATGSPACEEFRRGEVPPRQTHERVPQVQPSTSPAPQEHVLTCFECPLHEHDMVNPTHGWGRCTLKKRGCYGLRPACSEIQRRDTDVPLDG